MAFSYKFLLRAKQPTQLPTHFKLLGESKVRILRPWQTAQPRLSIQDDPLEQIRARLANQSISMSEVLGAACRAPKRQRVGSRRSSAAAKGKSGSGFSTSERPKRMAGACARKRKRRSALLRCQNTRRSRSWQTTLVNTPVGSAGKAIRFLHSVNCGRHSAL